MRTGALVRLVGRDLSRYHPVKVQQTVLFSGAAEHLHLFDEATGRALS
jgi:hypothetical protein